MNRKIDKLLKLGAFGVAALASLYAAPSLAAGCVINGTHNYQLTGQLVVLGTEAPGTVLRTNENAATPGSWQLTCTPGSARYYSDYSEATVDGILPLKVDNQPAGIGVRLFLKESRHPLFAELPVDDTVTYTDPYTIVKEDDAIKYELVRLSGPVVYGRISTGRIGYSTVTNANGQQAVFRTVSIPSVDVIRPTCSISADTLTQQVNLGDYAIGQIQRPGDTTPWRSFKLTTEKCESPKDMFADITFGTVNDKDATNPNLFAINGGGASGVGIELATDTEAEIIPGTTFSLPAVATGENFNFKARLKRTTPTASAGRVLKPVVVQVDFR